MNQILQHRFALVNDNYYLVFEILKPCYDLISEEAQAKGVQLKISHNCEAFVCADKIRIQTVVINLIQNAINASDAGETVYVDISETGDHEYTICILDKGSGLPS